MYSCKTVYQSSSVCILSDVKQWKAEQERKDMSKFVLIRSASQTKGTLTWQYECNRSGSYVPKGSGKRRVKTQGSCKSGSRCPAMVTIIKRDGWYHVTYYPMHYGHEKMLCHLSLSSEDRKN